MFDFVKKAGDYVKERATRDIAEVVKFNDGLAKSRDKLARDLGNVLQGIDVASADSLEAALSSLEGVLITADMGVDVVDKVIADLRADARADRLSSAADVKTLLKASLTRILEDGNSRAKDAIAAGRYGSLATSDTAPTVIMVIGANGMGKTTTIGKLATRLQRGGSSVLVAAGDTFRAGAVEQLAEWVKRADVDFVVPQVGSKSASSVVHDAMTKAGLRAAQMNGPGPYDYVILDTSGRLHTNANLMGELQKMVRVVRKFRPDAPHEVLLVVDASIGRNAVAQARTWQKEIGVTGLAVTKLDGTARAGFVISIVDELQIPVKFIGVGETVDDLRDFDAELFVSGLVGE
jgi:fused signal recognition particle receptor